MGTYIGYIYKSKTKRGRKSFYIVEKIENFKPIYHRKAERIDNLKIEDKKWDNHGIYYILKDNDIYIGSTVAGFRKRFKQHYSGNEKMMEHTYNLLQRGGEFYILHDMTNVKDEPLVRMVESEYIDFFSNYTAYNVINRKEKAYSSIRKRNKITKCKYIMVDFEQFDKAIKLLKENNISIKKRKKRNESR